MMITNLNILIWGAQMQKGHLNCKVWQKMKFGDYLYLFQNLVDAGCLKSTENPELCDTCNTLSCIWKSDDEFRMVMMTNFDILILGVQMQKRHLNCRVLWRLQIAQNQVHIAQYHIGRV